MAAIILQTLRTQKELSQIISLFVGEKEVRSFGSHLKTLQLFTQYKLYGYKEFQPT